MKKIFWIITLVFLLSGCSKELTKDEIIYNDYVDKLKQEEKSEDNLPFDLEIFVDKIIEKEVMYRVIIDNPKVSLRNIEALVIHDKYTEDVYPSTGIFESKLSLIPGVINKTSNYVEGIILAGYIPYEGDINNLNATFKVLFKYEDDEGVSHTIIYSTKK